MPSAPATHVIDAFKNLIRHGRQHNESKHVPPAPAQVAPSPAVPTQPRDVDRDQARSRQQDKKQTAAPAQDRSQPMRSQSYRPEAELIVQEENENKAKLPVYKGMEQFKLVEKMGDGAFSNVYKAIDAATSQKVAIKAVRKYELNASQEGNKHLNPNFKKKQKVTERANILKEVQIMRGTNHPSIVKLINFSESDDHYFLVLELMDGGELFHQIVKLTYFSENLSRHVILQVAQGIRYLHEERGVVHRDIKPENLLFSRIPIIPSKHPIKKPYDEQKEDEGEFVPGVGGGGIGRIKIADFGLSKVVWNEQTMTPCGTVGYTAPEIVKDERYSKSVDMWALGCVLYTLLCGFPPFYDESINVLTEKVARGHYTFLSPWWDDISASSKDLITHLLCVDPAQRYTIDEFLAHPWCNESPAPMPPPTPLSVPPVTQYSSAAGLNAQPLDSPLLAAVRGAGREARSPGLATLKEAFDITYAVHRMEEEGARRRAYNGPGGAGTRGFLQGLNEDDEDEAEDSAMVQKATKAQAYKGKAMPIAASGAFAGVTGVGRVAPSAVGVQGAASRVPGARSGKAADNWRIHEGRAGPRDRAPRAGGFDLDMENATLLGRRHRRGVDAMGGGRFGGAAQPNPFASNLNPATGQGELTDVPQSPMQIG